MSRKSENLSLLEKAYYDSKLSVCDYFKAMWIQHFKASERTFYNRLKRPMIADVVLWHHVTGDRLKPNYHEQFPYTDIKPFEEYERQNKTAVEAY